MDLFFGLHRGVWEREKVNRYNMNTAFGDHIR